MVEYLLVWLLPNITIATILPQSVIAATQGPTQHTHWTPIDLWLITITIAILRNPLKSRSKTKKRSMDIVWGHWSIAILLDISVPDITMIMSWRNPDRSQCQWSVWEFWDETVISRNDGCRCQFIQNQSISAASVIIKPFSVVSCLGLRAQSAG